MATPITLVDTTFSGKNITTAISVYEYTASADYSIRIQVRLAAVAGNGDYVAHLTLNDGDAQSDDVIAPRTTYEAAVGETAFWFATMTIDVKSGDVVNIFILGQAGDTSESGTVRIFTDDWLQPTTAARKLDVASTGEAGLDFDNIKAATGATTLTNITVPAVTTVNGLAANVVSAAAIAADAGVELGTAVWATETRTLTQSAASASSTVSGTKLTITKGDTLSATFTGLPANTDYVSIDFSYKASPDDSDDNAIIRIRKNASTTNDGLTRFLGAAVATPYAAANGSITVVSSTSLTINLVATATDDLEPGTGVYDIQYIFAASVLTATASVCEVVGDVTRLVA